jgi:hypothetical protein
MERNRYQEIGIPIEPDLGTRSPPDYAILDFYAMSDLAFGTIEERELETQAERETPLLMNRRLTPYEMEYWGLSEYWSSLEAALLLAGLEPTDKFLYLCSAYIPRGGLNKIYCWAYREQFISARIYLHLFERSKLSPKAPPNEWLNYLISRNLSSVPAEPSPVEITNRWKAFFSKATGQNLGNNETYKSRDDFSISENLRVLITAEKEWWSTADRDDPSTHPENKNVASWLQTQGMSKTLAEYAASILRPAWAHKGRKPKK